MSEHTTGVPTKALDDVLAYLLAHEEDIALGINDFGELRYAFAVLLGREAEKHVDSVLVYRLRK